MGLVALREQGKLINAWPLLLTGGASDREDLLELLLLVVAGKEGLVVNNLGEDAADWPDVNWGRVVLGAHQYVGRTVPQSDDFVGEVLDRDSKGTGQAEISKLEDTLTVDKKILGLEISMKDLVLMALTNTGE
jgi:hypothetical protein